MKSERRSTFKYIMGRLCALPALLMTALYLCSLFAKELWVFDLFRHFVFQYFILGILFSYFLAWVRAPYVAAIMMLVTLGTCYELLTTTRQVMNVPPVGATIIKIALYNKLYSNTNFDSMLTWIQAEAPDILILQEAQNDVSAFMEQQKTLYPYQIHKPRPDAFGMIIASKFPFEKKEIVSTNSSVFENFYIHAKININDKMNLTLYAIHPPPPVSELYANQRNKDLKSISAAVKADVSENIIMAGDWNITPYSPYFKDLLKETEILNEYTSLLPPRTWPTKSFLLPWQIPIDHILTKGRITLIEKYTGLISDSDHFPLVAKIAIE